MSSLDLRTPVVMAVSGQRSRTSKTAGARWPSASSHIVIATVSGGLVATMTSGRGTTASPAQRLENMKLT